MTIVLPLGAGVATVISEAMGGGWSTMSRMAMRLSASGVERALNVVVGVGSGVTVPAVAVW
ncbi:MAG: hypothetical protein QF786_10365, partial [Vicinamibacterales bacterium]|nr:hypothetical protein [Vicinamibacterales bacterium]